MTKITNLTPPVEQVPQNVIGKLRSSNEQLFQQVLAAMLLQNNLKSDENASAISEGPLILMLLEQMLANQLTAQPEASTAPVVANNAVNAVPSASVQEPSASEPSGRPVGGVITQRSHPGHVALDFGVPIGTEVHATMSGKVVYAGWNDQGYGNLVIVENGPYRTYYAHLSSVPVMVGESVSSRSVIGLSGSTGNSTGPHVHYEIRKNMVQIDPTQATLG